MSSDDAIPHGGSGEPEMSPVLTEGFFRVGFIFALVLAGVCLLTSVGYLFYFLIKTTNGVATLIDQARAGGLSETLLEVGINVNVFAARVALQSCAVFVGMAFGFLGFALFLLGVRGELDLEARNEGFEVKLARMSPGVFVLLLASALIAFAISRPPSLSYERSGSSQTQAQGSGDVGVDNAGESESTSKERLDEILRTKPGGSRGGADPGGDPGGKGKQ